MEVKKRGMEFDYIHNHNTPWIMCPAEALYTEEK